MPWTALKTRRQTLYSTRSCVLGRNYLRPALDFMEHVGGCSRSKSPPSVCLSVCRSQAPFTPTRQEKFDYGGSLDERRDLSESETWKTRMNANANQFACNSRPDTVDMFTFFFCWNTTFLPWAIEMVSMPMANHTESIGDLNMGQSGLPRIRHLVKKDTMETLAKAGLGTKAGGGPKSPRQCISDVLELYNWNEASFPFLQLA